ncbi:hypothetical protein GQ44DRAFT_817462 [Phaeosphaeriaceae sp. PMI808]|nr:hypothetical protein GQ44DRAFT_817462 [Phaeosphaeriaceae sp. PMI808]
MANVSMGAVLLPLAGYMLLCRLLRHLRETHMYYQYPYKTRESFAKMTAHDAWAIQRDVLTLEFPFIGGKGLQYALFKTYGISAISKLLIETGQLSTPQKAAKRYADTGCIFTEWLDNAPESERANAAYARLNFLHSHYQKAGKISNDDMLYTLAVLALEPKRWIAQYEWRKLNDMELCAFGTFWKSAGDAMSISYESLPSHKSGFTDGLQWLDELADWVEAYELQYMVPDANCNLVANHTTDLLNYTLPKSMHNMGKNVITVLLDERLRKAMMYPRAPAPYYKTISAIFSIRKNIMKYCMPPRPAFLRYAFKQTNAKTGRINFTRFDAEPWYVEPTLLNCWGPAAWVRRLQGLPLPGKGFQPEGYVTKDVGPDRWVGKGEKEFEASMAKLMAEGRGGCPFAKL